MSGKHGGGKLGGGKHGGKLGAGKLGGGKLGAGKLGGGKGKLGGKHGGKLGGKGGKMDVFDDIEEIETGYGETGGKGGKHGGKGGKYGGKGKGGKYGGKGGKFGGKSGKFGGKGGGKIGAKGGKVGGKIGAKGGKGAKFGGKTAPRKTYRRRRGRTSHKKRQETYSSYIYKVLKQVHPQTGISKRAMAIMNSLISDIFERVTDEAVKLVKYNNKYTLTSREVQTSVRLILPGELAKHAVSEAGRAVTKYSS